MKLLAESSEKPVRGVSHSTYNALFTGMLTRKAFQHRSVDCEDAITNISDIDILLSTLISYRYLERTIEFRAIPGLRSISATVMLRGSFEFRASISDS